MSCRNCQSSSSIDLFNYDKYKYVKCSECGLVSTLPMPSLEEIKEYYERQSQGGNYAKFTGDVELQKRNIFKNYLRKFEESSGQKLAGKSILDLGCFNGVSMSAMVEFGADPYGIELQGEAAREANQKFPGKVIQGDASDISKFGKQFDIITMSDVIEHLVDPFKVLSDIRGALNPGGYLMMTTPNTNSFMAKLLGKIWPSYTPIHHLFLFNEKNLAQILSDKGFELVAVTPLWKKLSLGYVKSILPHLSPVLGKIAGLLPDFMNNIFWPLNGGEMYMVARVR